MHSPVDCSASGNNTIVAAVSGKIIRVTAYTLISFGTVTFNFRSGDTPLHGAYDGVQHFGLSAGHTPDGHFQTERGEALHLHLSATVQVSGHITYTLIG